MGEPLERTAADVVLDAIWDSQDLSPAETTERVRKYLADEGWRVVQLTGGPRPCSYFWHIDAEWLPSGSLATEEGPSGE